MKRYSKKNKKSIKCGSTAGSNDEDSSVDNSLTTLNDDSLLLYNAIQIAWHEYQNSLVTVFCLDLLPIMATESDHTRKAS